MVLVLFAIVVFAFLLLGSTAFVLCVLLPPTRKICIKRGVLVRAMGSMSCGADDAGWTGTCGWGARDEIWKHATHRCSQALCDARLGLRYSRGFDHCMHLNWCRMAAPKGSASLHILSFPDICNGSLCRNRKCVRMVPRLVGRGKSAYSPRLWIVGF
jgi:hypothetical protein